MGPLLGGCSGRWEMAALLSSARHDQNIVLFLIMLFIIGAPFIVGSFNISRRVIDSGCQQSSR